VRLYVRHGPTSNSHAPCLTEVSPTFLFSFVLEFLELAGGSKDLYYHWNHGAFRELVQSFFELFETRVLEASRKARLYSTNIK
jgi:hypothetical protein